MKPRISALVDGELEPRELDLVLAELRRDAAARDCWQTYHLISDAMRDLPVTSPGFAERLSARLAAEPTVLAPAAPPAQRAGEPVWFAWSAAAGVAAVALVGGLAFTSARDATAPAPAPLARVAPQAVPAPRAPAAAPVAQAAALPGAASDYLLAHQGFSPRVTLQGVAPYVRTVAEPGGDLRAR